LFAQAFIETITREVMKFGMGDRGNTATATKTSFVALNITSAVVSLREVGLDEQLNYDNQLSI
jgi:hypothetical protein